MWCLHVLFLLALLASCDQKKTSDKAENTCKTSRNIQPKADYIPSSWEYLDEQIVCFYKLDDKYSDSEDSNTINNWWQSKLEEIVENGVYSNLLEHQGGGPNGAEWNADTDLFFAVVIPQVIDLDSVSTTVKLNDIPVAVLMQEVQQQTDRTLFSFAISSSLWKSALRPINDTDISLLFPEEMINKPEEELIAPLNTGEVFVIEFECSTPSRSYSATGCFHVAFGE